MGLIDGKRAREWFNEMNADPTLNNGLEHVLKALHNRNLGQKHFDSFRSVFSKIASAETPKTFEMWENTPANTVINDQSSSYFSCFMALGLDKDENLIEDLFIPNLMKAKITSNSMFFSSRTLPITLSSEHIEFRHIEKGAEALKYDSAAFKTLLISSLALSLAKSEIRQDRQTDFLQRSAVYASKGLFLGYSTHYGSENLYPDAYFNGWRNNNRLHLTPKPDVLPAFYKGKLTPSECIHLRTYIPASLMAENKKDLFVECRKRLGGIEELEPDFENIMESYVDFADTHSVNKKLRTFIDAYRELMLTPEWKSVNYIRKEENFNMPDLPYSEGIQAPFLNPSSPRP